MEEEGSDNGGDAEDIDSDKERFRRAKNSLLETINKHRNLEYGHIEKSQSRYFKRRAMASSVLDVTFSPTKRRDSDEIPTMSELADDV